MSTAGIFALRHKRGGILLDRLFSAPPSEERLAAEQLRLDRLYGPGWLRVVPVTLELAIEHADLAERLAAPPEPPPPPEHGPVRTLPGLVFKAVGTVTPPR